MKKQLYIVFLFCSSLFAFESQQSFWETYTAALRGDKNSEFNVGVIYERGIGVDKNETLAAQWYEKAAHEGHADAQYNLAIMYASGRGVAKDDAQAMMWLALAARQGDKEARKLLLEIIDGKLGEKKSSTVPNGEIELIAPTTLIAKEDVSVCENKDGCRYKANTVFTSTSKRGNQYKISGTVTKKGWQDFTKEGWIDEASVEVRR
jgi:TPR repeat protein